MTAPTQPPTKLIVLPSAAFELRLGGDGRYSVIGVHRTHSGTAQAMLGMTFTPGDSPMVWAQGYAMRIQAEINTWGTCHHDDAMPTGTEPDGADIWTCLSCGERWNEPKE